MVGCGHEFSVKIRKELNHIKGGYIVVNERIILKITSHL